MHSASILTLITALGVVVNAAPAIDIKRATGSHTIAELAPFQEPGKLPVLASGVSPLSFDFSKQSFGYPEDSDEYKCHGSCGSVMRVSRTKEKCNHPYAQPLVDFCFGSCSTLNNFTPYESAQEFKTGCGLEVSKPRSTSAPSAVASDTRSASQASSTLSFVVPPTATTNPTKQSASASTSTFSTATATSTGTVTPANSVTVTAGAASISFNIVVAITVATFAIV